MTNIRKFLAALFGLLIAFTAAVPGAAQAQSSFSQRALDQMLAPIALYPDPLLSQVLMAATYPRDVVEAADWSRAHPDLQGDDAVRAVADEDWDPSVKSLVASPQLLARMDEKLDWTRDLGDAFLAQEAQVMDTVQQLRRRAHDAGNLESSEQLDVQRMGASFTVRFASQNYVYVPYYDPMVVYGSWWWPAYRPVYWSPWAGYARHRQHAAFWWGRPIRVSNNFFFGNVDWQRRHVHVVHVNNYYYRSPRVASRTVAATPGRWQHNPHHRRDVAYRDPAVRARFDAARQERRQDERRDVRHDVRRDERLADRKDDRRDDRRNERRDESQAAPAQAQPQAPAATERRADRQDARRDERRADGRDARRDERQAAPAQAQPQAPAATERRAERRDARRDERRVEGRDATRDARRDDRRDDGRPERQTAPAQPQSATQPRAEQRDDGRAERQAQRQAQEAQRLAQRQAQEAQRQAQQQAQRQAQEAQRQAQQQAQQQARQAQEAQRQAQQAQQQTQRQAQEAARQAAQQQRANMPAAQAPQAPRADREERREQRQDKRNDKREERGAKAG